MVRFGALIVCLALLPGCVGTTYTSRIKDEPLVIDPAFRAERPKAEVDESGSLFKGDSFSNLFFSDRRAKRVGDIITVKIVEVTSATEKATTETGRESAIDAGISGLFGIETRYPARHTIDMGHLVAASTKNSFSGSGETTRQGTITATVSAKVVEVLPNGNLAIEGRREISVNNERKEILLQGVVRQSDIDWDNSIFSTQICDAKIIMTGVGVIGEKQSPGWLTRIFDLVWPF
jgi:flagellar L-ring protein precursor FlgH